MLSTIRLLGVTLLGVIGMISVTTVTTSFAVSPPPINDNIADGLILSRMPLPSGGMLEEFALADNTGATAQPGEPEHDIYTAKKSVWFKWTADTGQPVTVYTTGSQFDKMVFVERRQLPCQFCMIVIKREEL